MPIGQIISPSDASALEPRVEAIEAQVATDDAIYNLLGLPNPEPNIILTNTVVNGDFASLTGWSNSGVAPVLDTDIKLFGTQSAKYSAVSAQSYSRQTIPFTDGHKIYARGSLYFQSYTTGSHKLNVYDLDYSDLVSSSFDTSLIGSWQTKSLIKTVANGGIIIACGTPSSTQTSVYNVDGIIAIDLTEKYGEGNEPTQAYMDALTAMPVGGWFGGTIGIAQVGINNGKVLASVNDEMVMAPISDVITVSDRSKLNNKVIVNFGDSLFGNSRPPNDVSTYLSEITGANVHNVAFGGCRMSSYPDLHWDAFSMYRLAYSVVNNDFSIQDDALLYEDRPSYAEEPMALLKAIDFDTVDYITIAYGTNDFSASKVIDNLGDPYDVSTFKGAARYSLKLLSETFKNAKIALISPAWRFWMDELDVYTEDSDTRLVNGVLLSAFVTATREVAEEFHCIFIDNYEIGINQYNRSNYFPANDGTHHSELGRRRIASNIESKLISAF
jgi:lysophospholipase L1-like esterase